MTNYRNFRNDPRCVHRSHVVLSGFLRLTGTAATNCVRG